MYKREEYDYAKRDSNGKWILIPRKTTSSSNPWNKDIKREDVIEDESLYMNIFPFGRIKKENYEIATKYKLIEKVVDTGIWRLTDRCRDNYEESSFMMWLEGKLEKPMRVNRKNAINELLKL